MAKAVAVWSVFLAASIALSVALGLLVANAATSAAADPTVAPSFCEPSKNFSK